MRLRDSFLSLVKGGFVGISSLIPSLSSGSVMFSISIYHNFIEGISNIFKKDNKKLYLFVIPFLVGLLAGCLGGFNVINYFYSKFPNQTIFLFVGLLIGGIKLGFKNSKLKPSIKNTSLILLIAIVLSLFYILFISNLNISFPPGNLFKFLIALLIGITILIPGIPISSYTVSLNKYNDFSYLVMNFSLNNLVSIIIFITGIIIGIFLVAKILHYLFSKYNKITMLVFISLVISSIVVLIYNINSFTLSFSNIFTSILTFLWGYIFAINLERENDR